MFYTMDSEPLVARRGLSHDIELTKRSCIHAVRVVGDIVNQVAGLLPAREWRSGYSQSTIRRLAICKCQYQLQVEWRCQRAMRVMVRLRCNADSTRIW